MTEHLDVDAAAAALGDSHVILLRGHRFHAPGPSRPGVVDVTDHPEINDLVLASDVAVLDYSSLRFDYALTGRPMVFLVPDLEDYTGGVRGLPLPVRRDRPGPLVRHDRRGGGAAARRTGARRAPGPSGSRTSTRGSTPGRTARRRRVSSTCWTDSAHSPMPRPIARSGNFGAVSRLVDELRRRPALYRVARRAASTRLARTRPVADPASRGQRDRPVLQRRGVPRGLSRLDPRTGLRATSRCCSSTTAAPTDRA